VSAAVAARCKRSRTAALASMSAGNATTIVSKPWASSARSDA
jgi:hypothetical protein